MSGANRLDDLTHEPQFAGLCGFSDDHLLKGLSRLANRSDDEKKEVARFMRAQCNGYRFAGASQSLYNSTLCIQVLKSLTDSAMSLQDVMKLAVHDRNLSVSETVVDLLRKTAGGTHAIADLLSLDRVKVSKPFVHVAFKARQFLQPTPIEAVGGRDRSLMMLFYFGIATFAMPNDNDVKGQKYLCIPHEVVREQLTSAFVAFHPAAVAAVSDFVAEPTVGKILAMTSVLLGSNDVATLCDNNLFEVGVHALLVAALQVLLQHFETTHIGVSSEQSVAKSVIHREPVFDGTFGILIVDAERRGVLLEVKRVRPSQMIFDSTSINGKRTNQVRDVTSEIEQELSAKTEKQLRAVRIMDGRNATVDDLMQSSTQQTRQHVQGVKERFDLSQLKSFVVLSLATRVLVDEV